VVAGGDEEGGGVWFLVGDWFLCWCGVVNFFGDAAAKVSGVGD
jgi:hypothetical protein